MLATAVSPRSQLQSECAFSVPEVLAGLETRLFYGDRGPSERSCAPAAGAAPAPSSGERIDDLLGGVRMLLAEEALSGLWEDMLRPRSFVTALLANFR